MNADARLAPVLPATLPLRRFGGERAIDLAARLLLAAAFLLYGLPDFVKLALLIDGLDLEQLDADTLADMLCDASLGLFVLLIAYLAMRRLKPIGKAAGLAPRLAALLGTVLPMMMVALPPDRALSLGGKFAASMLTFAGSLLAVAILMQLGRSFSITPQARRLVTTGAYGMVRHPLYLAEFLASLGVLIRFLSPAAVLVLAVQLSFQLLRMRYEEAVLDRSFPDYAAYRRRTARLIPFIY